MNREDARINVLREILEPPGPGPRHIGDDAAVLPWTSGNLVVSVDAQVEGTHFRRDWCSAEDIGYRSLMAAASDLAAMGVGAIGAVAALALPPEFTDDDLRALAKGQKLAADEIGCPVVGGNLTRSAQLSVTTTVMGSGLSALSRRGAKPGESIYVAGALGLARAGLLGFERGIALPAGREAFCRPKAQMAAGIAAAAAGCSACMDVSDGLAEDAPRLATASNVTLWFQSAQLLALGGAALVDAARVLGSSPLDLALEGGEDYALLCTGPKLPPGFTRVGVVREASNRVEDARVYVDEVRLTARGFSHFAE